MFPCTILIPTYVVASCSSCIRNSDFSMPVHFLYYWIPMFVGVAKYLQCEYFAYMCWHEGQSTGMEFLYHTFVPLRGMIFCMYFVLYGISVHYEVRSGLSKNIIPTLPSQSKNEKKKAFTPTHHGAGGGLLVPTRHGISRTPPLPLPPPRTGSLNSYLCRCSKIFAMWIFCLHVLTWGPVHRHGFFVPYLCTLEGYDFLYVFCTLRYFSPLWN